MKSSIASHKNSIVYQVSCEECGQKVFADFSLTAPNGGSPLIIFTDGSSRSDYNDSNRLIAELLLREGFGTGHKRLRRENPSTEAPERFSLESSGKILLCAIEFLQKQAEFAGMKWCLLATGDGVAAAMYAAATDPAALSAIVLSGGRPGQALSYCAKITVPTLFILGSGDRIGDVSMKAAYAATRGPKELALIQGATHLLREPGAPEDVAKLSADWYRKYAC